MLSLPQDMVHQICYQLNHYTLKSFYTSHQYFFKCCCNNDFWLTYFKLNKIEYDMKRNNIYKWMHELQIQKIFKVIKPMHYIKDAIQYSYCQSCFELSFLGHQCHTNKNQFILDIKQCLKIGQIYLYCVDKEEDYYIHLLDFNKNIYQLTTNQKPVIVYYKYYINLFINGKIYIRYIDTFKPIYNILFTLFHYKLIINHVII
jgi:hypothetical protein